MQQFHLDNSSTYNIKNVSSFTPKTKGRSLMFFQSKKVHQGPISFKRTHGTLSLFFSLDFQIKGIKNPNCLLLNFHVFGYVQAEYFLFRSIERFLFIHATVFSVDHILQPSLCISRNYNISSPYHKEGRSYQLSTGRMILVTFALEQMLRRHHFRYLRDS